MHDVSKSQSQMSDVIRTFRDMYGGLVAKSVIVHDQEGNEESSISSSSFSITPCSEATSLAVLSVNDEVNESLNTGVQEEEEEEITTMMTTTTPVVNASHHDSVLEEEDDSEEDDDVLARECVLLVEGGSDDDNDEYVYVSEEYSHTTTTIADDNDNDNDNDNVTNNSINDNNVISNQDSFHDSSANILTAITTTSSMCV